MLTDERFWSKVSRRGPDECWPWLGATDGRYGEFWLDGKKIKAHRVAYTLATGDADPIQVCHSCDNPPCCNPAHLWSGTMSENIRDAHQKGRVVVPRDPAQKYWTHCKAGHEFSPENTRIYKRGQRVKRVCRACLRLAHQKSEAKAHAALTRPRPAGD